MRLMKVVATSTMMMMMMMAITSVMELWINQMRCSLSTFCEDRVLNISRNDNVEREENDKR